jgi:hypothetical protein
VVTLNLPTKRVPAADSGTALNQGDLHETTNSSDFYSACFSWSGLGVIITAKASGTKKQKNYKNPKSMPGNFGNNAISFIPRPCG